MTTFKAVPVGDVFLNTTGFDIGNQEIKKLSIVNPTGKREGEVSLLFV